MEGPNSLVLFGGLAFFLYGMQLAREGLQQAAGARLRSALGVLTGNRFSGLAVGAGVTVVLQSSSATTVMLVGFAAAGLMSLAQVMAVILGADIGTTVTVQLIAFKVSDYSLALVGFGALGALFSKRRRSRHIAEIVLGFGLIFYGMKLMSDATAPLKHDEGFLTIMTVAETRPLLALFASAAFTAIVQSSAATIGLVLSLAQADGGLGLGAAVAAMLGANIGTCATALLGSVGSGADGRRVAVAHLLFKVLGVALIWPFLDPFCDFVGASARGLPRQIANAHTLFNIGISAVFLPFIGPGTKLVAWLVPKPAERDGDGRFGPRYLDKRALDTPPLALAYASREVHRMADIVQEMLTKSIGAFSLDADDQTIDSLEELDDQVDTLDREIKLYLANLSQSRMSDDQARQELALLSFTSDLEQVGDIISNNITELARKRLRRGLIFSSDGFQELNAFHGKVLENYLLAISVFSTEDRTLANQLLRHKKGIAQTQEDLRQSHIDRLHQGLPETRETTSIHMDLLSNLRWLNSTVSNIAFVVLRNPPESAE